MGIEVIGRESVRDARNVAAKDRDIAMVFQSYALYPHMSVYRTREDLLATVRVVAIWAPKHSMGDLGSYEPAIKG